MPRWIKSSILWTVVVSQLLVSGHVRAEQRPSAPISWAASMISSGPNYPTVDISKDGLIDLLAELHQRRSLSEIRQKHAWSQEELSLRIERLQRAGMVKQSPDGSYFPTFMVISAEDAARYLPVSGDLVRRTCDMIARHLPKVREQVQQIPGFRERSFDSYSFLVLSNVLLDNWQIREVESSFLASERPLRDGKRYYFSIKEVPSQPSKEAFGIYGNGGTVRGGKQIQAYGNDRYRGRTLLSASDANLQKWFPTLPAPNDNAFWTRLLERLSALDPAAGVRAVPADLRAGMENTGLIDRDKLNFVILPPESMTRLNDVAKSIAPDLLALLKAHEPALRAAYAASPYKDETTFNEYFIWWYHFFYTRVTDQLATDGLLQIPMSGNFTYLVSEMPPRQNQQ